MAKITEIELENDILHRVKYNGLGEIILVESTDPDAVDINGA